MDQSLPLRDALIEAGMALLEEGGRAALTLRKAAARANVSHAAPAHHFDGLPGLLTAIAARAFRIFADRLEESFHNAGAKPWPRLQAICQGYLAFAKDHAGLFHLMFVSPEVDRADPDLTPHSARSYQALRDACLPFSRNECPDLQLEFAVWSMVHGYATLGLSRDDAHTPDGQTVPEFPALLAGLLSGRSDPAHGPPTNPLAPGANLR